MQFRESISNEEVAALDAAQFPGKIVVVDTLSSLNKACKDLNRQSMLGVDTETRPSFTKGVVNKVSLLQISTDSTCYLIRLNRVPITRELVHILENKNILKIGLGLLNDIQAMNKLRHFSAQGFIDLQKEAPKYGIADQSLRKLSSIVLGLRVSKAQRLSNWEANQFTEQQKLYAATDAWICTQIYKALKAAESDTLQSE